MDEYFPEYEEVFKCPLSGKASRHILKTCPFPKFILELGEDGVTDEDKKGSKENRWEKEGSTAYRDGKGIHRGGLRGGSGKAETAAYAGRTGAFRETDGRTGSTDVSCITEDRLCGIPAKHKRNRSCDAGGMSGGTWQSGKI